MTNNKGPSADSCGMPAKDCSDNVPFSANLWTWPDKKLFIQVSKLSCILSRLQVMSFVKVSGWDS